jgi:hypothetical protein
MRTIRIPRGRCGRFSRNAKIEAARSGLATGIADSENLLCEDQQRAVEGLQRLNHAGFRSFGMWADLVERCMDSD